MSRKSGTARRSSGRMVMGSSSGSEERYTAAGAMPVSARVCGRLLADAEQEDDAGARDHPAGQAEHAAHEGARPALELADDLGAERAPQVAHRVDEPDAPRGRSPDQKLVGQRPERGLVRL